MPRGAWRPGAGWASAAHSSLEALQSLLWGWKVPSPASPAEQSLPGLTASLPTPTRARHCHCEPLTHERAVTRRSVLTEDRGEPGPQSLLEPPCHTPTCAAQPRRSQTPQASLTVPGRIPGLPQAQLWGCQIRQRSWGGEDAHPVTRLVPAEAVCEAGLASPQGPQSASGVTQGAGVKAEGPQWL